MNQFKPIFLGREKPDFVRAADTQKCVRVSGKHNDLEEVGVSPYHHTFFEMLGNWSFGDYFKKEAIVWGWELLTQVYKLPKDKLYASVYETDDEAEALWKSETDIDPTHVLRFGKKDNFWSMGDTGPCGPCSELHIDRGPEYDSDPAAFVNTGSPRYIELWNLVFIQYDAQKDGTLIPLPARHVDTGAGLERITTVLNKLRSNYDTDLFQPIIQAVAEMSGHPYHHDERGIPHRVIADHLRCLSFAVADGAMPGNEGRGYVLRRILRRAARFGRKLEMHEPFIYKLVPVLVDTMGGVFPELKERHAFVTSVLKSEEEHFGKTLDRGLEYYDKAKSRAQAGAISGKDAFMLHDTYGFPLDLTQLMAREDGLDVDVTEFETAMQEQKTRARASGSFKNDVARTAPDLELAPAEFVGYDRWDVASDVELLGFDERTNELLVSARVTPFYAESGGQVADQGVITLNDNGRSGIHLHVRGVERKGAGILHRVVAESEHITELLKADITRLRGKLMPARLVVDPTRRIPTQYNHTATHLLQAALRQVLGDHVHQQGSLVAPDYLRFDYTHFQKPTAEELARIEEIVNHHIRANYPVTPRQTTLKEAQALGAMALFGEKYGEDVRLVEIGTEDHYISRELCGGCHVTHTGDIGVCIVKTETSVAAGVRRIEALTGSHALRYLLERRDKVNEMTEVLVSEGSDPLEKLKKLLDEKKKLEKDLEQLRSKSAVSLMQDLASKAVPVGRAKLVAAEVDAQDLDQLKETGDALREALGSGVGVLTAVFDGKPALVVVVTPDLVKQGVDAVPIVKELAKFLQGGGGGKAHIATAGGKNAAGVKDVHANALPVISKFVQ